MKSSLYNHIRILLISLFTLVSNGAAWGQTFLSGLSKGGKLYKHYVGTDVKSPFTVNLLDYTTLEQICKDLAAFNGVDNVDLEYLSNNFYIRWSVVDNNGNLIPLHSYYCGQRVWQPATTIQDSYLYYNTVQGNNDYYYYSIGIKNQYAGSFSIDNCVQIFETTYKFIDEDISGWKVVCYISDDRTLDQTNLSNILLASENALKICHEFIFSEKPDEFLGTAKDGSNDITRLHEYKGNINAYTFDFTASEDYSTFTDKFSETKPKYIRWYVADATTGKMIENGAELLTMPDGFNPGIKTKHGYYWSGDDFSDAYIKNITLNVGAENALDDYSLVMIASTDLPTFDSEGNIEKEPDHDYKYTLSFKKSFFSADTEYDVRNRYVLYDESTRKATINFYNDELSSVLSYFNKNSNAELASNYYLRWALEDKDGNIITLSSNPFTDNAGGNSTYKYNSSTYYTSSLWAGYEYHIYNSLNTVTITLPEDIDYKTTKVTLVLTDNVDGAVAIKDAYNNVTSLELEPNDLKLKYEYQLLTNDDAAAMTIKPYESVIKEYKNLITLAEADTETNIDFYNLYNTNDFKSEVFGITNNNPSQLYIRWYIVDKKDNVVSELNDETTGRLTNSNMTSGGADGLIISNSTIDANHLNVTYTKGTNKYWGDYKVVCIITDDLNGMQKIGNSYISDPTTIKARIVYYFTDGQDRFSGEKKGTIDDVKKSYTLTAAELAKPVKLRVSELIGTDVINDNAVYFRWVVKDELGFIVDDDHVKMTMKDGVGTNLHETEYGYIWYSDYTDPAATFTNDMLDVEVTSVNGNNLTDYTYTCYISKDITNAVLDNGEFTREPDYDLKCEFTINQRFMFYHYKGVTGRDWVTVENNPLQGKYKNEYFDNGSYGETTDDIRQGTHEWTYEIYVKKEETVNLVLPLQYVEQGGQDWEPQGYFRWYDWNTDFMSSKIAPYGEASNNKLQEMFQQTIDEKEISRGLFYWWNGDINIKANINNMAAVKFTVPSDEYEDWTGDIIACDVSKYIDGLNADYTVLNHEPTLSTRYKFIIRPAEDIADAIKDSYESGGYYEEHGNVSIGTAAGSTSGSTSLRLNLSHPNQYYFYNYDENGKTWGKTLHKATRIIWKVENNSSTVENSVLWKIDGGNYTVGKEYEVVAYASCTEYENNVLKEYSAPVARFKCVFIDYSPKKLKELSGSRTTEYIESHYSRVGLISFDIEEGSTLDTPTKPLDNMNPMPFKWQRSHYGYCYPQLYDYLIGHSKTAGLSPIHGDYTILKSMNLDGVSISGCGYNIYWWKGALLQDLTHHYTGGSQSGYFLYVDASDESRPIANVEFEGEMCTGSTLILTAMVADMTSQSIHPELMFKLYGVHTDANGNETERKLIHSFATSQCTGTLEDWYQVYAKVTLPNNTGVENYQHFLVSIDNYCSGTLGADYAIDDIRIYMQNSKVEVLQNSVLCSEANKATTATIRMKHETLKAMIPFETTGKTTIPVYYRICKEDGTVVQGAYSKEMYLDFEEGEENDADRYITDGNGERYFIIANEQEFALDAKQKYYVSVAMPVKNTGETYSAPAEDSGAWGNPTSVCSMYSEPFEPLIQSLNLMVNGNTINRINVKCNKVDTEGEDLSITGALQVPDPETGELVSIDDPAMCSFDWVVEVKGEQTIITDAFRSALQHFRKEYYKDTDNKYYTAIQDAKGEFTSDDKALLESAIASKKLYLCASSSLAGPIYKVGNTYTITAIPLEIKLSYKGKDYDVCPSPMEVVVEARLNGPELNLGFERVNYESAGMKYGADGLRVGKAQLENMQQDNVPLHLPINAYKELQVDNGKEYYEVKSNYDLTLDDFDVIIWDSNDPTWQSYLSKDLDLFGEFGVWTIAGEASRNITNSNKSVELQMQKYFARKVYDKESKTIKDIAIADIDRKK